LNQPVVNERGERLLAVVPVDIAATVDFVLVIALLANEIVLVHNRTRGLWELPGGFVDPGESPDACAQRELLEESGQRMVSAIEAADILIKLPDGASRRGRVFHGALAPWSPFAPNAEVDACRTWAVHALPVPTSAIDAYLLLQLS